MNHGIDDLELYAVGALPAERSEAIAQHLRSCEACRAAAEDLDDVVASLADAVPQREPPARLRARILAAAQRDVARARRFTFPRISLDRMAIAMAAVVVLLAGSVAGQSMRLATVQAEGSDYERWAAVYAHGGRTWYMAGVDEWKGMGGNLLAPASGGPAVVLFHDLRPLANGQLYTLWLIAPDGKWVRGTSFRPEGRELQLVKVGQDLSGFERCAVTVETSDVGPRQGPIVMQSRIAPPTQ